MGTPAELQPRRRRRRRRFRLLLLRLLPPPRLVLRRRVPRRSRLRRLRELNLLVELREDRVRIGRMHRAELLRQPVDHRGLGAAVWHTAGGEDLLENLGHVRRRHAVDGRVHLALRLLRRGCGRRRGRAGTGSGRSAAALAEGRAARGAAGLIIWQTRR